MPKYNVTMTRTITETLTFSISGKDEDTAREKIEAYIENETNTAKIAKRFRADLDISDDGFEIELEKV